VIKSHVIQVEGESRADAEILLGAAYNRWAEDNPGAVVVHWFEPVRRDRIFGDSNYNRYYTSLTFFYEEGAREKSPKGRGPGAALRLGD
jgi:hypothetical protein